jgi:dTDP-4-dehydrorhamnose reductase
MREPVLGTGLSGLVGSRLVGLLSDEYEFTNLDLTLGVDILDPATIERVVAASPAKSLLHLAAFTDVNAAQQQDGDKNGACYRVNVDGTRNVAEVCAKHQKHLVHLSTGYVFDGQKNGPYTETDPKNPTDWYSVTKSFAEDVVTEITPDATILRINFPYRTDEFAKRDIWHKIADGLKEGKRGPFFADHYFTLTPIEWLSEVVRFVLKKRPAGIFHATTDQVYSDLTLAREIQKSLGLSGELLSSSVREYNRTAARPYQPSLILSSEKLKKAMAE